MGEINFICMFAIKMRFLKKNRKSFSLFFIFKNIIYLFFLFFLHIWIFNDRNSVTKEKMGQLRQLWLSTSKFVIFNTGNNDHWHIAGWYQIVYIIWIKLDRLPSVGHGEVMMIKTVCSWTRHARSACNVNL